MCGLGKHAEQTTKGASVSKSLNMYMFLTVSLHFPHSLQVGMKFWQYSLQQGQLLLPLKTETLQFSQNHPIFI